MVDEFVEASHARPIIFACVTVAVVASFMIWWGVYIPKSRQANMNYGASEVGQALLLGWSSKDTLGNPSLIADKNQILSSGSSDMFGWTWQARVETDGLKYTAGYSGLLPKKTGSTALPILVRFEDGHVEGGKVRVHVW